MQNFRSSTAGFNGESECWLFTVKCNSVVDVWALFITSYSKWRLSKETFEGLGGFAKYLLCFSEPVIVKMVLLPSRQNEAINENLRKSFSSNNPTSCSKQQDYTSLQEIQFPSSVFFRANFLILKKIIFLFVAYEEKQRRIVYHSADWCQIVLKSSFAWGTYANSPRIVPFEQYSLKGIQQRRYRAHL